MEIPKDQLAISLLSNRNSKNALIGFTIVIIHEKKKFKLSSKLYELIELEMVYESLSKEIEVLDRENSEEALRQIKFQTEFLKSSE